MTHLSIDANKKDRDRIVNAEQSYSFHHLRKSLQQLKRKYASIWNVSTIGKSVLGKELYAVRIGTGPRRVHYNGSFHANEWITTILLMQFVEDMLEAYCNNRKVHGTDVKQLFKEVTLDIVPMVNPDGVELVQEKLTPSHPHYKTLLILNDGSTDFSDWKANVRGVDLNDQFPAHWYMEKERRSTVRPGPRDYSGPYPMSEPEAIAMAEHTRKQNFDRVIAFHTQGEEIYWNYRGMEPPSSKLLAKRMADVSGYRAVELTDSDAGFKDWFIQDFRRPGFTVECGHGKNPLPISDFTSMYNRVSRLMLEGLKEV